MTQPDAPDTTRQRLADNAILDPRRGDIEDDASSTKQRSLLSLGGTLLLEVSVFKLVFALLVSITLPALLLGVSPLLTTAWTEAARTNFAAATGLGAILILTGLAAIAWFGLRPLWRMAETNFWSLNALFVQPAYLLWREGLQHLGESVLGLGHTAAAQPRIRAMASAIAGVALCLCGLLVCWMVWPWTQWLATPADLARPARFFVPALANATLVAAGYLAVAALVWGFADATMDPVLDFIDFVPPETPGRRWRVVHLSDIHVVGEPYGMRVESGRLGPSGNGRLRQVMARIALIDVEDPIDLLLISGDMTDAGRSSEWIEFFDVVDAHPALRDKMVILPGNHDVNIVDRANPAKLELPFSPYKRLRQLRCLSAMDTVQGRRMHVFQGGDNQLGVTLSDWLAPYAGRIVAFANRGWYRHAKDAGQLWQGAFPMVIPPAEPDGLGVVVLDSNAETHYSFTNALGLISLGQAARLAAEVKRHPDACWIVALHHHLIEYPMRATAFSDRVGTALVNGSWFIRMLNMLGPRIIAMHGHRHVDWIGRSGNLTVISAPSPVMEALDGEPTYFYLHTFVGLASGRMGMQQPERIVITGRWNDGLT